MLFHEWAERWRIPAEAVADFLRNVTPEVVQPEGASESRVQSLVRLAAANRRDGSILMRNNSGATTDDSGRMIRYGLGNDSAQFNKVFKSSDLVGVTPIVITAAHVGYKLGVATFIEVKKPGWKKPSNDRERAQMSFLADMSARGAITGFATCADDYSRYVGYFVR